MRCLKPFTVGFQADGKTICWSSSKYSKEYPVFQLPCGKCIECRLEQSRTKAIRCVHESMTHDRNCFITLTYSDDKLKSPKLDYRDFKLFVGRLRDKVRRDFLSKFGEDRWDALAKEERRLVMDRIGVGYVVTGEYGELTKRPHWHALIFNWEPSDTEYLRTNELGDRIFKSKELDSLWGFNDPDVKPNEIGALTFRSAGYVCRYASKKLVHGFDQDHDFHPVHRMSNRYAIGRRWLEKHWRDVFNHGYVVLPGGQKCGVPRYYEKWLKIHEPSAWIRYVTETKFKLVQLAERKEEKLREEDFAINWFRLDRGLGLGISRLEMKSRISEARFQLLNSYLKGDI